MLKTSNSKAITMKKIRKLHKKYKLIRPLINCIPTSTILLSVVYTRVPEGVQFYVGSNHLECIITPKHIKHIKINTNYKIVLLHLTYIWLLKNGNNKDNFEGIKYAKIGEELFQNYCQCNKTFIIKQKGYQWNRHSPQFWQKYTYMNNLENTMLNTNKQKQNLKF